MHKTINNKPRLIPRVALYILLHEYTDIYTYIYIIYIESHTIVVSYQDRDGNSVVALSEIKTDHKRGARALEFHTKVQNKVIRNIFFTISLNTHMVGRSVVRSGTAVPTHVRCF